MIERIERDLAHSNVDVRREAVLALRARPVADAEAVRLLLHAMKDPSWRVRKTAVDTLVAAYPQAAYQDGLLRLIQLDDNAGARNSAIEVFVRLGKRATDFLMQAFGTPDPDQRKFIIDILGRIGDRKCLPLVVGALTDGDENVRASAVEYLGTLREASVIDILIEILRKGDLWTAYPAADALGRIGDRRAVPSLVEALDEKTLREPALRALGAIGDPAAASPIAALVSGGAPAVQYEALKALEALYHKGVAETAIASALMESMGGRALGVLLDLSHSQRAEARPPAILLLGILGDRRALEPLLEMSTEEEFAEDIRRALVFIGRRSPDVLLPLFGTDDPYLRRFIVEVAADVASPIHVAELERFLANEDGHVRAIAARGLAAIGSLPSARAIMRLLEDPYVDVQEAAVRALGRLGSALGREELFESMRTGGEPLRRSVALLLGELGGADAIAPLGFALKDPDVSVRKAATASLALIGDPRAYDCLTSALMDEDTEVRAAAILSLGASGRLEFARSLALLLEDPEDMIKVSAVKALAMLGSADVTEALASLLGNPNGFVVTAAIDALGALRGELAREALIGMLDSGDREVRRSAIRALAGFPGAEDRLVPFLTDPDWAIRIAAVEALAASREPGVRTRLEALMDAEDDSVVRKALTQALDA
jgi:HEAT repeat protein